MSISSDSMWRWRFSADKSAAAERAFHRFWSNTLRWLVRDPEHSRIQVLPGKRRYTPGEPVTVNIKALQRNYEQLGNAAVFVRLKGRDSNTLSLHELRTDEAGHTSIVFPHLDKGPYIVEANLHGWTSDAPGSPATTEPNADNPQPGRAVFLVQAKSTELASGAPRPNLLRAIAKATGGRYFDGGTDAFDDLELRKPNALEIDKTENIPLWDNAAAMLLAFMVLGGDWALRRRRGYY